MLEIKQGYRANSSSEKDLIEKFFENFVKRVTLQIAKCMKR